MVQNMLPLGFLEDFFTKKIDGVNNVRRKTNKYLNLTLYRLNRYIIGKIRCQYQEIRMNIVSAVFLSFLMFSIQAQAMQLGEKVVERLSKCNLKFMRNLSSDQTIREDMLKKSPSVFEGSKPKKKFSANDLIKDDTVGRLVTYAKPINHEGTLLKVKKHELHKESGNLKHSVLRAPGLLDRKWLDGFSALYDRRKIIREPYTYPHYLTGFLLTEFGDGIYQRGSGLLIGDRYGLTAKHCFFAEDGEAKSGEFLLGASNNSVLKKTTLKNWKTHEFLDLAIFEVDRPVGDELGWASLRALKDSDVMEKPFEVSITGYPAHKRFLSYYLRTEKDMFTMRGPINKLDKNFIYYNVDTSGGQSGAGITRFEDEILESYGVHTTGTRNPVEGNEGVRIDSDLLSFIETFIKQTR